LAIGEKFTVLKTSDELDWPDLNVSLASAEQAEFVHRAIPDLWLSMALDQTEIAVAIGGQEQKLTVPVSQLAIIAPETPWSVRLRSEARILNVFVRRRILTEVANELCERDAGSLEVLTKFNADDRSMAWLLHSLKEALYEPQGHANLKVEYISRALAADVLRKYTATPHEDPVAQGGLTARQARLVANYIQEHLSSKIFLKDLTALTGFGQTIFIQRFKVSFGMSPHRYVTEARVSLARKLLKKPDLPLVQVAALCGFADQSHLGTTFKRTVGMTPSRYRHLVF